MNGQTNQNRKIPERRCTGCGSRFPKSELYRIVRTPEGEIVIDGSGTRSGRGAYICKSLACFKKSRKQKRLDASLECTIPQQVYDTLERELCDGE